MKTKIEKYKRETVFANLKDYCHLAKEDDFIEITEWKNGDGIDLTLSSFQDRMIQLTWGELRAIKKLTKKLDESNT